MPILISPLPVPIFTPFAGVEEKSIHSCSSCGGEFLDQVRFYFNVFFGLTTVTFGADSNLEMNYTVLVEGSSDLVPGVFDGPGTVVDGVKLVLVDRTSKHDVGHSYFHGSKMVVRSQGLRARVEGADYCFFVCSFSACPALRLDFCLLAVSDLLAVLSAVH